MKSSGEVFQVLIQELEKIASPDTIKEMLSHKNNKNQNLLQTAVYCNESSEFHKTLWKILRKYFEKSEILDFVKHCDRFKWGIFSVDNCFGSFDIVKLTRKEVESFLTNDEKVEYVHTY